MAESERRRDRRDEDGTDDDRDRDAADVAERGRGAHSEQMTGQAEFEPGERRTARRGAGEDD